MSRMTDRAEIERLLQMTGRTLEGLPPGHNPRKVGEIVKPYRFPDRSVDTYSMANHILHQSDVIELLVGALRDALEKPMQKPLTLTEANSYQEPLWIEFRDFKEANGWRDGLCDALNWAHRVYKDLKREAEFMVHYRCP